MSSYSESISKESLKEIQGKLISYCKDNEGFGKEWRGNAIDDNSVDSDSFSYLDDEDLRELLESRGFVEKDGEYVKASDESIKANFNDIQYNENDVLVNYRGYPLDDNFQVSMRDRVICRFLKDLKEILENDGYGIYDFNSVYVDYIMAYDLGVARRIVRTDYCTYSYLKGEPSVSISVANDSFGGFDVLDEFCPNLVDSKYVWSSPKKAGVLKKVLNDSIISSVMSAGCIPFDTRTVMHIHMENEKLMYRFYIDTVYNVSADETDKIYAATDELMKCIQDFKKPIKEIYTVSDMSNGLYIARKNPDGEYTITVY